MDRFALLPATEQLAEIRAGNVSAREAVEAAVAQIEGLDDRLRAFITVRHDEVRREADELDNAFASGERLALHGLTLAIKDAVPTAGIRTTYGSVDFANHVPQVDVGFVRRLRAAGALIVGKTSTPDLDAGGLTTGTRNEIRGITVSPWNEARSSGGSSGGTAVAVATGMAALGVGTDLGGSIRVPAAYNGICGLRGTAGLVPTYPNAWPLDTFSVAGPMCRTIADLDLLLRTMSGPDLRSPLPPVGAYGGYENTDARRLRIAWSEDLGGLFRVDLDVRAALRRARLQVEEIGLSTEDAAPDLHGIRDTIMPLRSMRTVIRQVVRAERLPNYDPSEVLAKVGSVTALDIANAELTRSRIWARCLDFFEGYDVLALPTTHTAGFDATRDYPHVVEDEPIEDILDICLSTYAITMMGWPSLSIPCGFSEDGEPVGLQLTAPHGREDRLLNLGRLLETELGWTGRLPPAARE